MEESAFRKESNDSMTSARSAWFFGESVGAAGRNPWLFRGSEALVWLSLVSRAVSTIFGEFEWIERTLQAITCTAAALFIFYLVWILSCRHVLPWKVLDCRCSLGYRRGSDTVATPESMEMVPLAPRWCGMERPTEEIELPLYLPEKHA